MAFKIIDGLPIQLMKVLVGSGGSTAGSLAVYSSGAAVLAAANISANTIMGIFRDTVASASYATIELLDNHLIEADFTGSSKSTLAATDLSTVFDLSDAATINLDDTTVSTGGFRPGAGGTTTDFFDNTNLKIRGKFPSTLRLY